jgi:hypothetical protein
MTTGGWLMLIGSWAFIIGLNVYCGMRLFTEKPARSITTEEPTE